MAAAPWSVDAVLGLAPDASSANAARGLAAGGRWEALGRDDTALWGLARGSGSTPYQTAIDVAGTAYRCSCPSRKVPCKHALALMLLHAGSPDAVPEAEAPPWVREWLESRRERAERSAARGEARGAPDAEAQARRAAQRAGRVEQGLAELERWLSDLVRGGVAAAPSRSYAYWDAAAARLVDAQAPRLARRVRELAGAALARDEWTERLVGDLGRLALLVDAARHLDELPPDLASEVRSQLGFTGRVRGRCPRRARRGRLARGRAGADRGGAPAHPPHLAGRRAQRRRALLMAFAAGTQPLEPALAPGTIHHAALAWYPGAPPTRALVVGDAVAAGVMEGLPPGGGVEAALAQHADALAQNPWHRRTLVLLDGVRLVRRDGRWHAVDAAGDALPLVRGDHWPLVAFGGGGEVALAGEWYGRAWLRWRSRPAAGWWRCELGRRRGRRARRHGAPAGAGRRRGLARRAPAARRDARVVAAAAGGGARRAARGGAAAGARRGRPGGRPARRPAALPAGGARAARGAARPAGPALAARRSGWGCWWRPAAHHLPSTCPRCSISAWRWTSCARRSARRRAAAARGSPASSPAGRTRCRRTCRTPPRRSASGARATSPRGSRWSRRCGPATRTRPAPWCRRRSPARRPRCARASWSGWPPASSAADEPLLESALDDRRREVRAVAAAQLAHLPSSALAARMLERARQHVRVERAARERLVVDPPGELDAALLRDGVAKRARAGLGERASWLAGILEATPLDGLQAHLGRAPAEALALPGAEDWHAMLLPALATAAVRQRDAGWAEALLQAGVDRQGLGEVLPPDARERLLLAAAAADGLAAAPVSLLTADGRWSETLTRGVLHALDRARDPKAVPPQLAYAIAAHGDPSRADQADELADRLAIHDERLARVAARRRRDPARAPCHDRGAAMPDDAALTDILRPHAEDAYADELRALEAQDDRPRPPGLAAVAVGRRHLPARRRARRRHGRHAEVRRPAAADRDRRGDPGHRPRAAAARRARHREDVGLRAPRGGRSPATRRCWSRAPPAPARRRSATAGTTRGCSPRGRRRTALVPSPVMRAMRDRAGSRASRS